MADKAWKATERTVAAALHGRRVPVSGRGRGDVPDVAHDHLAVEVKHRGKLPNWLHNASAQATASARDGKLPLVVLHEAGRRHADDFVVLRMRDWIDWYGPVIDDE
jgi:hypothetical protein